MEEIKIKFDLEKKTVNSIEGTENVDPLEIAKMMIGMAMRSLSMIKVKEEKVIVPKKKIILSGNGNKQ